jgi:DNA-binding transcriptional ArsR family regulator
MAEATNRETPARMFRALSVQSRVRIVRLLAGRTLCVGAMSNLLGISAGAVSQHLRILRDAGLVEPDRRGYFIHYHLAPGAAKRCRAAMNCIFGPTKGGRQCAAERRSVKGRRT